MGQKSCTDWLSAMLSTKNLSNDDMATVQGKLNLCFRNSLPDGHHIKPFSVVRDAVVGRIDQSCLHTVTSMPKSFHYLRHKTFLTIQTFDVLHHEDPWSLHSAINGHALLVSKQVHLFASSVCVCAYIFSNISNSATTRHFPGFASSMIGKKDRKIVSKSVVKNDAFPSYTVTLPKTNMAHGRRPSQKETHLPTPVFRVRTECNCWFQGG